MAAAPSEHAALTLPKRGFRSFLRRQHLWSTPLWKPLSDGCHGRRTIIRNCNWLILWPLSLPTPRRCLFPNILVRGAIRIQPCERRFRRRRQVFGGETFKLQLGSYSPRVWAVSPSSEMPTTAMCSTVLGVIDTAVVKVKRPKSIKRQLLGFLHLHDEAIFDHHVFQLCKIFGVDVPPYLLDSPSVHFCWHATFHDENAGLWIATDLLHDKGRVASRVLQLRLKPRNPTTINPGNPTRRGPLSIVTRIKGLIT